LTHASSPDDDADDRERRAKEDECGDEEGQRTHFESIARCQSRSLRKVGPVSPDSGASEVVIW
jgi:hypothetical protein